MKTWTKTCGPIPAFISTHTHIVPYPTSPPRAWQECPKLPGRKSAGSLRVSRGVPFCRSPSHLRRTRRVSWQRSQPAGQPWHCSTGCFPTFCCTKSPTKGGGIWSRGHSLQRLTFFSTIVLSKNRIRFPGFPEVFRQEGCLKRMEKVSIEL